MLLDFITVGAKL